MGLPQHVAFIMDGNGRWAQAQGLPRNEGHRAGTENIRQIIRHSKDLGIRYVTFYAFSTENFSRPKNEVSFLMNLLREYFNSEIKELHREGARIRILGDLSLFSMPLQIILRQAERTTQNNDTIHVNIALAYGGRQEILSAVNRILKTGEKQVDEEQFRNFLLTGSMPDPDLIIRTSGEQRLSNLLIFQAAYSELYFTSRYWPDFDIAAYDEALADYAGRTRRFGGIEDAN